MMENGSMVNRRALIIDTHEPDVQELRQILDTAGYQVAVARDSHEAVTQAHELQPEVVLLGIQSASLNGLQILQRLKKRGTTKDIPVLLLLEKFDEEHAAQGLQMGAEDYLLKTAGKDFLLRRVGVLARIRQKERRHREVLARYHQFFDGEEYGLFLSTREGKFLDVNENLVKILGYDSRDELLGIDIKKDLYWDLKDRERFQEMIESQGFVKNFKLNLKRKDGQKVTILLNGQAVLDEKGSVIGYEGYNIDISHQTGVAEFVPDRPEAKRFVGRFLKLFGSKVLPFGADFFSLIKMSELIAQRYEKVERLGLGSFGEVWKVRDVEREGRAPYYVAKIPMSKKLNGSFRREAEICRRLEGHPNGIKIVDVVEHRGRVVLVQEFVEGDSLKELMQRSLEETEKQRILYQLIDITAHAHRHRIVHRDIKPENILIRQDGTLKLLDYGVAKELKDNDISSTMVGSRPYMAPEQIMGESQIASDVWALGVIIYLLYTEILPFYDDNEKALMDLILTREPESPRDIEPSIPEELESIILKCLRKDPKERFADATTLKQVLLKKFPDFGNTN
jgi:PAS domain S-box-containing protein